MYREQQVHHSGVGAEQVPEDVRGDGPGRGERPLEQCARLGGAPRARGMGY